MSYRSDIEIAQAANMEHVETIAAKIGLDPADIECYGRFKAKVGYEAIRRVSENPDGRLILVTAITPTPAGEGKTTTSVGLADALRGLGKNTILALREPSLGPVFGVKGGAAGGGYAQVIPMEDINLHFTGDFHAIGAANNLLAAMIDNHIYQGNELNIDPRRIMWRRCVDMNDRQLRSVVDGLSGKANGVPREDGYDITVASEVMAAFCLSNDISGLREKLSNIVVAYSYDNRPVTAGELKAHGAMAALLKDALKPNLVQTLEHTPAFVHGGPFANIAHGCNSVIATRLALKLADYVVTEAGFGADLGAEKFCDIKCRLAGIRPGACVIVATARALKHHGGAPKSGLAAEDLPRLRLGVPNLLRHIDNMRGVFGLPVVVAINRFPQDTDAELSLIREKCAEHGAPAVLSEVWAKGGAGGAELAREVLAALDGGDPSRFSFAYDTELTLRKKIDAIARRVYRADGVDFTSAAAGELKRLEALGFGRLPVCIAKTQYSFTDDQKKAGAPDGFRITVRDVKVSAGAGFVVALTGDIMTMPGLPKTPAAMSIDVNRDGAISGLF